MQKENEVPKQSVNSPGAAQINASLPRDDSNDDGAAQINTEAHISTGQLASAQKKHEIKLESKLF